MMNKLFLRPIQHFFFYGNNSMAAFRRALPFSTQSLTSAITPLKPTDSVVPILENWVQQGNHIKYSRLQKIIRHLRRTNRFNHALQMLQWMGDKGGYTLSAGDIAAQLELISKVHAIKQVEMFFDAIPHNLRGCEVYYALLHAYTPYRNFGKIEATMQKIRELGFARNALPYNVLLSFYHEIKDYKKMNILVEEMREEGVDRDAKTYNILLKVYGGNLWMKEMEQLFTELEADPVVNTNWYHYFLVAQGYWNDEQLEKSLTMLKKSEESSMKGDSNRSLYSPPPKDFYVGVYQNMIWYWKADIASAERIWEEWFSNKKEMDYELPRTMIYAYALKRKWEKAEALVFRIRESGVEPDADILNYLAYAYLKGKQMDKAVETSMEAISVSKPGWMPEDLETVTECFEYLERQGDDAAKEKLYKMLKEHCGLPEEVCDDLKDCEPIDSGYYKNPRIYRGSYDEWSLALLNR